MTQFHEDKCIEGLKSDAGSARLTSTASEPNKYGDTKKLFKHVASAAESALRLLRVDVSKEIYEPCRYLMESIPRLVTQGHERAAKGLLNQVHSCQSSNDCPCHDVCVKALQDVDRSFNAAAAAKVSA